jgi:hypothetical protein
VIYHYTDLNAAKSILEKSELWLTDHRFLNDTEELIAGRNIFIEALKKFDGYPMDCTDEFIERMQTAIAFVSTEKLFASEKEKIFVSSFSLNDDSLTQWRSYGMFSLCFDNSILTESFNGEDVFFLTCNYIIDSNDAIEVADDIIRDNIIPSLLKSCSTNMLWMDLELSYLVDIYALSFKHNAFYDEAEVRLVTSRPTDNDDIQFRVKGNILIPYLKLDIVSSSIQCITVGPIDNQDVAEESLAMFSDKISRGVRDKENNPEYYLDVDKSILPFRKL